MSGKKQNSNFLEICCWLVKYFYATVNMLYREHTVDSNGLQFSLTYLDVAIVHFDLIYTTVLEL